jgi:putative transposase
MAQGAKQLGRIARNRSKTGIIAENEQDNADLWTKIRHVDEQLAHLVSSRIVQFARKHEATILVFEHLGNLKPEKGKYSRRGNSKRAFWMKGRIFKYAKYKAYNAGIVTSRVSPRNTSRECARCHSLVARYRDGQPAEGYTYGAPLVYCANCGMKGNSDRNASLVIGKRLVERYEKPFKEKPQTGTRVRGERSPGVVIPQGAKGVESQPSTGSVRHGDHNGHGTAQEQGSRMVEPVRDIPCQLRLPF